MTRRPKPRPLPRLIAHDVSPTPERVLWAQQVHGHSQSEAARHMGVAKRTFQHWVYGTRRPRNKLQVQALLSYIYGAIQREQRQQAARNRDTSVIPESAPAP